MNEDTLRQLTTARIDERVADAQVERLVRQRERATRRRERRLDASMLVYLVPARRDATP